MFENADVESTPVPAPAQRAPAESGALPELEALAGRLRAAGVRPRLLPVRDGVSAGGAALSVPVRQILDAPAETGRTLREIAALARTGLPLTLSLRELGGDELAIDSLEEFCAALRGALVAENQEAERIGISIQSHTVPLKAYLLITTALLGRGPRYVILDSLQMRHHDNHRVQRETDDNWTFLWRRRNAEPSLLPAYAASVTTRCALLGDEAATAILPELGIQAPVGTAWLPLAVHLPDFSDGRGALCWKALKGALETAVDVGERLLDRLVWPDPALERDARANRRLAIAVGGIGDLVLERGADPADLRCLQWIDGIVARLHAVLWGRSRLLARHIEPLPSLTQSEPTAGWHCDRSRNDWQLRWRRALVDAAVRHRNLLVLSPYSVLPSGAAGLAPPAGYADLLPVLHHADAFHFADPPGDGFRSREEFSAFHRRAWAVMQRRNAASFVATGV
jgi:hypothetical protein